jgi:hypothetical protein
MSTHKYRLIKLKPQIEEEVVDDKKKEAIK